MKNKEYNLNNIAIIIYLILVFVFFSASCPLVSGEDVLSGNIGKIYYAVIRIGDKDKLYTEGDIFYSGDECFRIYDIAIGSLILKSVKSKDIIKVNAGEVIPLGGVRKFFKKTVKIGR